MNAQLDSARRRLADLQSTDPATAYQARLAQAKAMTGGGGDAGGTTTAALGAGAGGGTAGNGLAQFNGQGDRWRLDSRVERPRAPYTLAGGVSVIPAILWGGINSELPGNIFAQVSQDVYDTATGQCKLIPQGTKLAGAYSSNVVYGQSRVLVAWQRLVFPDGKTMDIGAMPGSDGAGYAGRADQVNNHYVRIFGSAVLMSGVIAGTTYSQRNSATTSVNGAPTASSALSEALGQELGQVTAQMISKNLAIAPTIEIRPGFRLNVVATKDLVFPKCYQSFDY
jgi:type IV secretion system protein VirB10